MTHSRFMVAIVALAGTALMTGGAHASTLWVGYDTSTPVQRYTTTGVFLGTFGAGGATGTALDGAFAWTVQPGGTDSVITKYNAGQTPLATIHFTSGIDNGKGLPSWIEDMASGTRHTLWLSGFNGEIYHIDSTGTVLSHFDSGHILSGIEVVGSTIYTTSGTSGGAIFTYDLSGTPTGTILTDMGGMGGIGGLAYDPSNHTFWAGTFGFVEHVSLSGADLGVLSLPGAFHDGLAIGDLTSGVPEPGAWVLMLIGFGGLGLALRARKRAETI